MALSQEEAFKIAKERGLIPQEQEMKSTLSKEEAFQLAMDKGLIKPREDGAGFLTRTRFSFADTDKGRKQVLEDEYGQGNSIKVGDRWLVKDKKGWNYADEKSLSWTDAADLIGDLPEAVGAGVGGVMGSGWLSVPAAAAGGAIGSATKKAIAKGLGINNDQAPMEIASDMGTSATYSALGQGAGVGLVKGVNKILAPYASKMTPEAIARTELARKFGIELTPAQITQAKSLNFIENGMKNNPMSVDTISKFLDEKQLQPFSQAIKNMSPTDNADTIGKNIVESINTTKNANKQMFNSQYSDLTSQINKNIDVPSLRTKAQDIIEANKNLPDGLKDDAVKIATQILEMPTDNIDYNTLAKLRTNLGEKAQSGMVTGDIGSAQYKQLKGSLDSDFNNFANQNGLGSTKKDIDNAYRTFKQDYENNLIKGIVGTNKKEEMPTERVVDNIVNPKEISRLDKVIQASNNQPLVKDAVVTKVIDNSKVADFSNPAYGSEYVSPTRFATQTNNFGEHLSKVGATDTRELGKVAENIKMSEGFANHSNTAPTLQSSGILGLAGALPSYPMSKAYTSEMGRKWLTDGFKQFDPKSSGFGAIVGATLNNNQD